MSYQKNELKVELARGKVCVGVFCTLASSYTTELVAGSQADWILIDGEHSPNDLRSIQAQMQAAAPYDVEALVRLPSDDPILIKQFMDAGARSLMIPNIRNADQARQIVESMRYAPHGTRGFSVAHRANRFGRAKDYHANASENVFLSLQIECAEGVKNAVEIAQIEGVDSLFIGPGDLSTNLGAMGNPQAPHVQEAIKNVISITRTAGKASGIMSASKEEADRYIKWGCNLLAVGSDLGVLVKGIDQLVGQHRPS